MVRVFSSILWTLSFLFFSHGELLASSIFQNFDFDAKFASLYENHFMLLSNVGIILMLLFDFWITQMFIKGSKKGASPADMILIIIAITLAFILTFASHKVAGGEKLASPLHLYHLFAIFVFTLFAYKFSILKSSHNSVPILNLK